MRYVLEMDLYGYEEWIKIFAFLALFHGSGILGCLRRMHVSADLVQSYVKEGTLKRLLIFAKTAVTLGVTLLFTWWGWDFFYFGCQPAWHRCRNTQDSRMEDTSVDRIPPDVLGVSSSCPTISTGYSQSRKNNAGVGQNDPHAAQYTDGMSDDRSPGPGKLHGVMRLADILRRGGSGRLPGNAAAALRFHTQMNSVSLTITSDVHTCWRGWRRESARRETS